MSIKHFAPKFQGAYAFVLAFAASLRGNRLRSIDDDPRAGSCLLLHVSSRVHQDITL